MTHKRNALIFGGLALVFIIAYLAIHGMTLGPAIARGTGPGGVQVTGQGWLALAISAIGASGLSVATVVEAIRAMIVAACPPSAQGQQSSTAKALLAAVDLAEMPLYAKIYNQTTDPIVKVALRQTAKLANDSNFEKQFPVLSSPSPLVPTATA
jgi:hypothetical protein